MEITSLTHLAYVAAAGLSLLLTGVLTAARRSRAIHYSLILAAGLQTLWLSAVAFMGSTWLDITMALESLHYCAWMFALIRVIPVYCARQLPKTYRMFMLGLGVSFIGLNVLAVSGLLQKAHNLLLWQGLILAIVCLLNTEQLYRNVISVRLIKIISLNLAAIFICDIYLYSQSLIFDKSGASLDQLRATVSIVTSALIILATSVLKQQRKQPAQLSLSRPIVFYTTSLSIAGVLLASVSLAGYYMQLYGGDWGTTIYSLLLVATLILLASVFSSKRFRDQMSVLINKHFFSHKYDYRTEWLRLIEQLSKPSRPDQVNQRALAVVTSIIKSEGGALWLRRGKVFQVVHQEPDLIPIKRALEPVDSRFINALEADEWVFFPSQANEDHELAHYNELLPSWVNDIPDVWFILPLIDEKRLLGFMLLTCPSGEGPPLNWEDLDLLKTLGRQVSHYLSRQAQAEQLAEARQFEAFNKLSAYMMHDLKNLIAQQLLVVNNAAKHKDNPAFVEDAIQTISNSVNRMQHLLQKLQQNTTDEVRVLLLSEVLIEAVKRCQKSKPVPTLRIDDEGLRVQADRDNLTMVFSHLIRNAQDATQASGYVDLFISRIDGFATLVIEDNGKGMDEAFIQNRLFRPFDSTKAGKGMGIGMYQARDYILNLGGDIDVESVPGEGTTFVIRLPLTLEPISGVSTADE